MMMRMMMKMKARELSPQQHARFFYRKGLKEIKAGKCDAALESLAEALKLLKPLAGKAADRLKLKVHLVAGEILVLLHKHIIAETHFKHALWLAKKLQDEESQTLAVGGLLWVSDTLGRSQAQSKICFASTSTSDLLAA